MRSLRLLFILLFVLWVPAGVRTQTGIVNGRASYLPRPYYSNEARRNCADGKVKVSVLIGENGKVITANAISGDELLFKASEAAAKKARFKHIEDSPAFKIRGKLVYDFDHLSNCAKVGVVNKKALLIPRPVGLENILHPSHIRLSTDTIVDVTIVIDEGGTVISARATRGHPLSRSIFERSAKGAKFPSMLINPGPLKVKAILSYRLKPNGDIEY